MDMNAYYEKWDQLSVPGLLLMGLGLSVTGQGIAAKASGKSFLRWFVMGTLGLIIFNSGVALFGESVKNRALYESELMRNLHR